MRRWRPSSLQCLSGAGEPAARGREPRAAAVTRAPGRGAPPRRRSRGLSPRPAGAEPPAARPGPAPPGHRPRERAGRRVLPALSDPARHHTAPGAQLLADLHRPARSRPSARRWEQLRRRRRGCPRARTPQHPAPGVRAHLAPARRCADRARRGPGPPPVRGARPAERQGRARGRRRRGPSAGQPLSRPAVPAPQPAPRGGLRGRRSCELSKY